jgi:pyruvate carboxylase subunit B
MIYTKKAKSIRVMFTPFRDGLQSSFGGKVRLQDILPAMQASAEAGIRHFEFGGGARYQAPYFYLGEDPFEDMQSMRDAVGPDVDLQILTRSVSGVTLTTQSREGLELQAKLMKRHGTSWDRNFDFMNDVRNLVNTGHPIVQAGMHHQTCIALMGLPFASDKVHTSAFYIEIGRRLLKSDVQIDSLCLKDASGTTDPKTIYDTAVGLKKIMPSDMPLWMHTHDTASTAVACYMAAISGGADGVDLSVRPMASGTVQPDARSLAHALKGTGFSLDIDVLKLTRIENMLGELMQEYAFNPTTTTPDARVLGFPMPGGAIGPNVHMMAKAGILDRYGEVLAEFPVVVEAGGAWTSVTPGSQQYWLQAFNNVLHGRWKKIDPGFGKSVLGYFGRTPLPPDPEVMKIASQKLDIPVFEGDPLEAAPKNVGPAQEALPKPAPAAASAATAPLTGPTTMICTVTENNVSRTFTVTVEPAGESPVVPAASEPKASGSMTRGTPVHSTFAGSVDVSDIKVKVGDTVTKGEVVANVEAMKAQHDILAPVGGSVVAVHVAIGDEIDSTQPMLTIA